MPRTAQPLPYFNIPHRHHLLQPPRKRPCQRRCSGWRYFSSLFLALAINWVGNQSSRLENWPDHNAYVGEGTQPIRPPRPETLHNRQDQESLPPTASPGEPGRGCWGLYAIIVPATHAWVDQAHRPTGTTEGINRGLGGVAGRCRVGPYARSQRSRSHGRSVPPRQT